MRAFLTILISLGTITVQAEEPSKIIIACRSKTIGDVSYQIYGDLVDDGIEVSMYIAIDTQNPNVKPDVRKSVKWTPDSTYKPTKKYSNYNRYIIQKNTSDQEALNILIPTKSEVYKIAREESQKSGQDLVQGEFEAVLRISDDYGDGAGGQEYLTCGTGWLKF